MMNATDRRTVRRKRKPRIRRKISGTAQRPRLTVFKSLRHVYAQLINDVEGRTLVSAGTVEKPLRAECQRHSNRETAKKVGKLLAERAKEQKIEKVVFDRSGFRFHGVIKAIADGAREGGLIF